MVKISNPTSKTATLSYGVSHGSVLGPVLFNIYVSDLRQLLRVGRMVAWGLARRDRPGWSRRVSDATRPRRMLPIDDDDDDDLREAVIDCEVVQYADNTQLVHTGSVDAFHTSVEELLSHFLSQRNTFLPTA